jgi:hypothetical protein
MSSTSFQEITLLGGPDGDIKDISSSGPSIMHIELSDEVLARIIDSTKNGKPPKIQLGSNSVSLLGDICDHVD